MYGVEMHVDKKIEEIEIVIVEDDEGIYRGLSKVRDKLVSILPMSSYQINNYWVKDLDEFLQLKLMTTKAKVVLIVDINLGPQKKEEGFKILERVYQFDYIKIVYTASDSKIDKFINLGVNKNNVFSKGKGFRTILRKIGGIILEGINVPDSLIAAYNQSETSEEGSTTTDINIPGLLATMRKPNIPIKQKVDVHYISVQSDVIACFEQEKVPLDTQIALCKYFLNSTVKGGYNYYGLDEKLFEADRLKYRSYYGQIDVIEGKIEEDSIDKASLFISLAVNPATLKTERLYWSIPKSEEEQEFESFEEVDLSELDKLIAFVDDFNNIRNKYPKFICLLVELFLSQRLVDFYYDARENKENIAAQVLKLDHEVVGVNFMVGLWELITFYDTEDVRETIKELEPLVQIGLPYVKEVFFCKVVDIEATNESKETKIFHTEVFSLEEVDNIFPRAFDGDLLESVGVVNNRACFKLILIDGTLSTNSRAKRYYIVEPMHQSSYKKYARMRVS